VFTNYRVVLSAGDTEDESGAQRKKALELWFEPSKSTRQACENASKFLSVSPQNPATQAALRMMHAR